ncbi:MAG: AAA family ATPase [Lyngbya sp.]|nr:AAA family ATPase [Lyngbya sp.]
MIFLPNYQIINSIYESSNSLVYRAIRTSDQQSVILKLLKQDYPSREERLRYKQEYEITRKLNIEGVCRSLGLEKYQNTFIIIFEDCGGESLRLLMNQRRFNLEAFLEIARDITEILGRVHSANIIHKDINPGNIVYNPKTGRIQLIDFGISTLLSRENPQLKNPNVLEGTLAYMSPEQTGRMNRSLDYRTDLYSLGVTFYELLTHRLPFETTDSLELVHCHIAKQPLSPSEVNPEIPQIVSDIIMKLMAKTAEERYQSAFGIQADLEECLHQLHQTGRISIFPLARQDITGKLQIPQKLYGREQEIQTLLSAFERVSECSEMMLVCGYSGIGKSALVQELYKPITQKRSYFISGKFDQYQRNIPYSAIVSAFRELVKQILTETDQQLQDWREKILSALGVNGQVIIDVIPEVELIIGRQPPIPELSSIEGLNRFNLVFQNFIKVFTNPTHPLVIFLDDLQWADGASLQLIQVLMSAASPGLFLIGAYRDNEVSSAHPLMLTVEEIAKTGAFINRIYLAALDLKTVNQLLCDTLNCAEQKAQPLAELVLLKTGGNPFFMNEFIKSLYTDGLLIFTGHNSPSNLDETQRGWQWNLEQINTQKFTDNVVELMASKIKILPDNTQKLLKLAACISNKFNLKNLADHCENPIQEIVNYLWEAVIYNLIIPMGSLEEIKLALIEIEDSNESLLLAPDPLSEYRFVHDRIQQAAYSLIPELEKPIIHQKIGKTLLQNTSDDDYENQIFDIVNKLNFGRELISSQREKDELAELNLQAGKKAKASVAYQPAFNYLQVGRELLGEEGWVRQYELTLELSIEAAEAAYLKGDFEQMETLVKVVLKHTKTVLDQAKIIEVKILAQIAQSQLEQAISTGLEFLRKLGIKLPQKPTILNFLMGALETKFTLFGKKIENLANLPQITDPYKLAALRILSKIVSPAYIAFPNLLPLIAFKQVILSIKYGNSSESIYAYAVYGLILCGVLGDLQAGYEFGQLALRLLQQLNSKEFKTKALFIAYGFISHWKAPAKETLLPLMEAYKSGLETGDLEYAAYAAHVYCFNSYLSGQELSGLKTQMEAYHQMMEQLNQEQALRLHKPYHQAVLNLLNLAENPYSLVGKAYDDRIELPLFIQANTQTALCYVYLNKLILCYLFERDFEALSHGIKTRQYIEGSTATFAVPYFYFYDSLTRLAVYSQVPKSEQKYHLKKVKLNQKKIKKWAHHAPMNHLHKYILVEAEKYRVLGEDILAMNSYEQAIILAKQHEYINEVALAYELAAKFYVSQGKKLIAKAYLQESRYCYQLWGAEAKVKHLETKYSQLLTISKSVNPNQDKNTSLTCVAKTTDLNLDIATVIKASQAISGEILLNKLLSSLMRILIENAGAQKGCLILKTQGKLLIEASGAIDAEDVTVLQSLPIENCEILAESIVSYVFRTQETVVLNNGAEEGNFLRDPYIQKNQPKSILCVPLINQGQLVSIVYLENNLTTGAFTPQRVEVLKLLSGQAAISVENAQLYTEVRENESRFSQFLEAIPVGVAILDASGKPCYTNRVAKQLLGKEFMSDITVEQFAEVTQVYIAGTKSPYPPQKMPIVQALSGESTTVDDIEIHQGDRIIPIEVQGMPIYDDKGNIAYAIAVFQDITERQKAEAERQKFTNELFQLNKAYERFVPRQFLQLLDKNSIVDVQLGDQVQIEMSVLFSDIRNFTALSEMMTPEENFKFINSYLSQMEPAITDNNGFIDKYIGDEIMALFSGEADNAVKAGIVMLHKLAEYNQSLSNAGLTTIQIGIGINTGSLMLGTVGGQNRMDSTVISDAVNLASRIENLTKEYGVSLLISQQTFSRLNNPADYTIRQIDRVKVKGKSEEVTVYEVFDADPPLVKEKKLATLPLFTEACFDYHHQAFSQAMQRFEDCLRQNPGDRVARIYLKRSQEKMQENS